VAIREEARHTVKQYVNANENDALVFCGSGCTQASNLLINKLKLKDICAQIVQRKKLSELLP
jgi:selenocysteine lyase/cysteine desulfurase